ncbi:MAG: hypothetical protein EPN85_04700 [Bacteroidetes bacterium]|nr:MAG: hypothetical protein EPN85_04700 [Bacteroidota bacterium]
MRQALAIFKALCQQTALCKDALDKHHLSIYTCATRTATLYSVDIIALRTRQTLKQTTARVVPGLITAVWLNGGFLYEII